MMWLKTTTVSATTAFQDISQQVIEFSGIELIAQTVESHTMGDNYVEYLNSGLKSLSPIVIGAWYDDAVASGIVTIFGNASDVGAERVVKMSFGTTNAYPKQRCIVKRFSRKPARGELTKCEVEFLPNSSFAVVTT